VVGLHGEHLDPGADGHEEAAQDERDAEPVLVDEPRRGEDQRHVGHHEDGRRPVDVERADAVVLLDDVGDDGVHDPVGGVGQGRDGEQPEDEPAAAHWADVAPRARGRHVGRRLHAAAGRAVAATRRSATCKQNTPYQASRQALK